MRGSELGAAVAPVTVGIAYGYIEIGTLRDLGAPREGTADTGEFVSVRENVARIQAGTHTGNVEVTINIVEELSAPAEGRTARGETELTLVDHQLFASTFHGLAEGIEINLPDDWATTRMRATSPRYFEASMASDHYELDPPERIVIEFAPAIDISSRSVGSRFIRQRH